MQIRTGRIGLLMLFVLTCFVISVVSYVLACPPCYETCSLDTWWEQSRECKISQGAGGLEVCGEVRIKDKVNQISGSCCNGRVCTATTDANQLVQKAATCGPGGEGPVVEGNPATCPIGSWRPTKYEERIWGAVCLNP